MRVKEYIGSTKIEMNYREGYNLTTLVSMYIHVAENSLELGPRVRLAAGEDVPCYSVYKIEPPSLANMANIFNASVWITFLTTIMINICIKLK